MEIIKKLSSQKIILFTLLLIINSCGVYVQFDYDSDVNFKKKHPKAVYNKLNKESSNKLFPIRYIKRITPIINPMKIKKSSMIMIVSVAG